VICGPLADATIATADSVHVQRKAIGRSLKRVSRLHKVGRHDNQDPGALLVDARRRWQGSKLGSHLGTIICGNGRISQDRLALVMEQKERIVIAESPEPSIGIDGVSSAFRRPIAALHFVRKWPLASLAKRPLLGRTGLAGG